MRIDSCRALATLARAVGAARQATLREHVVWYARS
jgi:hypothetical protein